MASKKNQSRIFPGNLITGSRTTDDIFKDGSLWTDSKSGVKTVGTITAGNLNSQHFQIWAGDPSWTDKFTASWPDTPTLTGGDKKTFTGSGDGGKVKGKGGKDGKSKKRKSPFMRLVNYYSKKPKTGSAWKFSPGGYKYQTKSSSYKGMPGQVTMYKGSGGGKITYFNPSDGSPPLNWYGSGNAQTAFDNISGGNW